jgi:hypothetical protein
MADGSYPPSQIDSLRRTNLRGAIELGLSTIRALILVNGIAAGGLLMFFANRFAGRSTPRPEAPLIAAALVIFGLGVFFAVVCSLFAYISQLSAATSPGPDAAPRAETTLRVAAMLFAVVSALFFLAGVCFSGQVFAQLG